VNYRITLHQRIGLSKREVLKGLNFKIFASYLIIEYINIIESNKNFRGQV